MTFNVADPVILRPGTTALEGISVGEVWEVVTDRRALPEWASWGRAYKVYFDNKQYYRLCEPHELLPASVEYLRQIKQKQLDRRGGA